MPEKTPLYDLASQAGATFAEEAGWVVPHAYGIYCGGQTKSRPYRDRRWLAFAGPPAAYAAQLFM